MAGSIKGSVRFDAGADDYRLLLDFNALCDLEADFPGIMDGSFDLKSPKAIRRVFHVGLAEHHHALSERDAGSIIQEIGLERAGEVIAEAFAASFPSATGGEGSPRPRTAQRKAGAGKEP